MKKKSIFLFFSVFLTFCCSKNLWAADEKFSSNSEIYNSISQNQKEKHNFITKGYNLCQSFMEFLLSNRFSAEKEALIISPLNNYPFNINIFFPGDSKLFSENYSDNNLTDLTLCFQLEQASENKDFILKLLKKTEHIKKDYNLNIVFTYGDIQEEFLKRQLNGTDIYIRNLTNKKNMAAICIKLNDTETEIIPGGGGDSSPSWLIKRLTDSFSEYNVEYTLQSSNISTLYRFGILKEDKKTSAFLKEKIPACGLHLSVNKDFEQNLLQAMETFIKDYSQKSTDEWDRHFYSLSLPGKTLWISEKQITITFLILIIFIVFLLCEFSFRFKNKELQKIISRRWKTTPVSFAVTLLGMYTGQLVAYLFTLILPVPPYTVFSIKFIFPLTFIATEFIFIYRKNLLENQESYAYLSMLSSIFNAILFSFIDISFFYLYIAQYIICYIASFTKRTVFLTISFIILLLPYIPYLIQFFKYTKEPSILSLTLCNPFINIATCFSLLPLEISALRVLAKIKIVLSEADEETRKFHKQNIIAISSALIIFAVTLFILLNLIPDKYLKDEHQHKNTIIEDTENLIKFSYIDLTFFGETSRTIDIDFIEQPEQCLISLKSEGINPVIYSDEIYDSDRENFTDYFSVPPCPPEKLSFKYITQTEKPTVFNIEAIYPEKEDYTYRKKKITVTVPVAKED